MRFKVREGFAIHFTRLVDIPGLNGEVVQSSDTGHMIFSIPQLISYASTIFTLVPGDVIVTGTPGGVGDRREPPLYMNPGDVVEVEAEGIGKLSNTVADEVLA